MAFLKDLEEKKIIIIIRILPAKPQTPKNPVDISKRILNIRIAKANSKLGVAKVPIPAMAT